MKTLKDKTGHQHTVPANKQKGRTSKNAGHDHTFDWSKKNTGPGGKNNHTHPMPERKGIL